MTGPVTGTGEARNLRIDGLLDHLFLKPPNCRSFSDQCDQ
jgi:hypothetical protein